MGSFYIKIKNLQYLFRLIHIQPNFNGDQYFIFHISLKLIAEIRKSLLNAGNHLTRDNLKYCQPKEPLQVQ